MKSDCRPDDFLDYNNLEDFIRAVPPHTLHH